MTWAPPLTQTGRMKQPKMSFLRPLVIRAAQELGPNPKARAKASQVLEEDVKPCAERLGGYNAISAVANDLLSRLRAVSQLGRFWQHRGKDGIEREKQLLIDFLCSKAGGPLYYTGHDMKISHKGMKVSESDWSAFLGHLNATLDAFQVSQAERDEVVAFVESTKPDIVEA